MSIMAFKEWAVVCRALARGEQTLVVRKGGIAEENGIFRPEHNRFWLYPSYYHEHQQQGIKDDFSLLLRETEANRSPSGRLCLENYVEVVDVDFVRELDQVLAFDDLHIWTPDVITQRFHYRTPGLYVLTVRTYQTSVHDLREYPEYAGCKTWVTVKESLPEEGVPVLSEAEFESRRKTIRARLNSSR